MYIDFLDAYLRQWEDAEMLFGSERWATADHLYGLAAECGLKRLMIDRLWYAGDNRWRSSTPE